MSTSTALADRASARARPAARACCTTGCEQLDPGAPARQTVADLLADHPSADEVVAAAAASPTRRSPSVASRAWLTHLDGECRVGVAPPSRRWATAMLAWSGPDEPDGPSHYDITPPEPSWPAVGAGRVARRCSASTALAADHRARGGAWALRTRPSAATCARRRPAIADRGRLRRGVGPLRRGADARGGLPRPTTRASRSASPSRRWCA